MKTRTHNKECTRKCTFVYPSVTVQNPLITLHTQSLTHRKKKSNIYLQEILLVTFANKVEHNTIRHFISYMGVQRVKCSLLNWDGYLRQHLLQCHLYPADSKSSSVKASPAISHKRIITFVSGHDLWHHDTSLC